MINVLRHRLFLLAVVCSALLLPVPGAARDVAPEIQSFARLVGLKDIAGFGDTIASLRETGRLPQRYVTKRDAEKLGWKPGGDLCRAAPGRAIGGDDFSNREKRLPEGRGRRWFEADLDYDCGARGARRLVWSNDGLIFVTVDHYQTFKPVPGNRSS